VVIARAVAIAILCARAHAETLVVDETVPLRSRATRRSAAVLTIDRGTTVDLLAERGGWLKVRVRGRTGWIPHDRSDEPDDTPVDEPSEIDDEPSPRAFAVEVAAGLGVVMQGFRTRGGAPAEPDNYNLGITTAALTLACGYTRRAGDALVGVELGYAHQEALPGIRQTDPATGDAVTAAIAIDDASARLVAGYELDHAHGLAVFARAGVRSHRLEIAENPGRIPSERQLSPTLGAGIVSRATSALELRLRVDTFLAGTRTRQTAGLEDGVQANTIGGTLQAGAEYRFNDVLALVTSYGLEVVSLDFGAPDPTSARVHAGRSVSRVDIAHMLTIGIATGW
jgi:hypothetical protein